MSLIELTTKYAVLYTTEAYIWFLLFLTITYMNWSSMPCCLILWLLYCLPPVLDGPLTALHHIRGLMDPLVFVKYMTCRCLLS